MSTLDAAAIDSFEESSSSSDPYKTLTNCQSAQGEVTVTVLGKTRTFAGLDRNEWIFLIISVSCIVTAVGLTIHTLVGKEIPSPDFVFATLVLINAGFCLFYVIHGVLREREFELYCLILAVFIVTVYVIANFIQISCHTFPPNGVKVARFVLIVIFAPVMVIYAWIVGRGFGYLIFKAVGAKTEIQGMYQVAGRFSGLLKFDYQLAVILLVLTIEGSGDISYFAKCSLAVGIPFQLLASLIGWIAMRTEQLILVWCFLPLCCAEPAFIAYRITLLATRWNYYTGEKMEKITYSFIAAACCAVVIRVLLLVALVKVVRNFGKGLKFKVFQLPINPNDPPVLPSKRDIKKCCGMVCCGPIG